MNKSRVLFVCIHNSARSQMAEAYLRKLAGDQFEVESAGLEAGNLNPVAVQVMEEEGIDMSSHYAKTTAEMLKQGKTYNYVITVCDPKAAESCPVFPGMTRRLHWSFPDPLSFQGTPEAKLNFTRDVRNQIREAVQKFVLTPGGSF
ncbi:MAG TPA: arsenate reductase ArsC [Bacteroidia bacterium]|nr:arsenate reductase ArsC [Bacteroidia bacterium]